MEKSQSAAERRLAAQPGVEFRKHRANLGFYVWRDRTAGPHDFNGVAQQIAGANELGAFPASKRAGINRSSGVLRRLLLIGMHKSLQRSGLDSAKAA
jgi:hypothetical protein